MNSNAATIEDYIYNVSEDKREAITTLRNLIKKNLPKGFEECISSGMIGYVVPHKTYPAGYHCNPASPLPFVCLAAQKNFIAIYHMGIYAQPELLKWFTEEHAKRVKSKLDMGKSCIRYKKPGTIPYDLLAELMQKITVKQWIETYEKAYKR